MKYLYKINSQVRSPQLRMDVEADSYKLEDDYFHFYEGTGSTRDKVASVAGTQVLEIQRTDNEESK